jgi:hypothetical protein
VVVLVVRLLQPYLVVLEVELQLEMGMQTLVHLELLVKATKAETLLAGALFRAIELVLAAVGPGQSVQTKLTMAMLALAA